MDLIDGHAHNDLHWALLQLKDDADMRCAVIAAEGKCFSAGGDFNYMLELNVSPELYQKSAWSEVEIIHTLTSIPVPVIAAVHGDAIVLGTLGCDIVVASINAHIADPHVLVGLVAGDGGCLFWPRATGILQAKRYLLTGDYLPPRTAYEFGLMTDLAEGPEAVQPLADKFASKIASPSSLAVQGTKRSLNAVMQSRAAEVAALCEQQSMGSADVREAVEAIQHKPTPDFKGC